MTGEQLLLDVDSRSDEFWRAAAWQALQHLAASGQEFQLHDLTDLGVPEPSSPNHWGALAFAARKAGLIERCGFAQSKRRETRGSLVRLWRGAGRQR